MFLLPRSNYIGPGNSMSGGRPLNKVDYAAYYHDTDPDFRYFTHNAADERFMERLRRVKPRDFTERAHKAIALGWHTFKKATFSHDPNLSKFRPGETNGRPLRTGTDRASSSMPYKRYAGRFKRRPKRYRKKRVAKKRRYSKRPRRSSGRRSGRVRRRIGRRSRKFPTIMNQTFGIKFKRMRTTYPKLAAVKCVSRWNKIVHYKLDPQQIYFTANTSLNPPVTMSNFNASFSFPMPQGADLKDKWAFHQESTYKYCQVFKCGQWNSVFSEPHIHNLTDGANSKNVLIHEHNPSLNSWGLEQIAGTNQEKMAMLYRKGRVAANKYSIRLHMLGTAGDDKRYEYNSRVRILYGIFYPKQQESHPFKLDPEEQFASEVMNRTYRDLRAMPGVKGMQFTGKKSRTVRVYIPVEKLRHKRNDSAWLRGANIDNVKSTLDTQPAYVTGALYSLENREYYTGELDGPVPFLVPFYRCVNGANLRHANAQDQGPLLWFMTFVTPGGSGLQATDYAARLQVSVKETRYSIFEDPHLDYRTGHWSYGKHSTTGASVKLPEYVTNSVRNTYIPMLAALGENLQDVTSLNRETYANLAYSNNNYGATPGVGVKSDGSGPLFTLESTTDPAVPDCQMDALH